MRKHTATRRPNRLYVVDSSAAFHTFGRNLFTKDRPKTIRPTDRTHTTQTANGIVEVPSEAKVYIKELDVQIHAMLVNDSPAVLSLERL